MQLVGGSYDFNHQPAPLYLLFLLTWPRARHSWSRRLQFSTLRVRAAPGLWSLIHEVHQPHFCVDWSSWTPNSQTRSLFKC